MHLRKRTCVYIVMHVCVHVCMHVSMQCAQICFCKHTPKSIRVITSVLSYFVTHKTTLSYTLENSSLITVLTRTVRTCRCLALETYASTFAPHQQIPTGMGLSLPNPEGGPELKVGSWLKKQRQRRQVTTCMDDVTL